MRTLINGAGGRIGRAVTREVTNNFFEEASKGDALYNERVDPAALNEPRGIDYLVENFKSRDPVHGLYDWKIQKGDSNTILINGYKVPFYAAKNLNDIPFKDLGIDTVLECSGFFGDPKVKDKSVKLTTADNQARAFLNYGVKKIIQTYPAKTADISMIMGVNHELYNPAEHNIISNASCTTKALSMPLQVLLDNGINVEALSMDTTHAATASQGILESLGQIITHSTGAAKATGLVIPSLSGKMGGMSYRVPTLDGSFANLYFVATSDSELTAEKINDLMRASVVNPKYAGRIGVHEGEDAGTFDIVGRRENSVVIPSKTTVIPLPFSPKGKKASLVTLIAGYDNELGSSVDPVLLAKYVAKKN
jgi:glyceraldehyde 3-phosphate dehydrogenase